MPTRFSGAPLWPTLYHCVVRISGPLCFIYNAWSRILHYPDPPRVGPAFNWLVSTFPRDRGRVLRSAWKGRGANHIEGLIYMETTRTNGK